MNTTTILIEGQEFLQSHVDSALFCIEHGGLPSNKRARDLYYIFGSMKPEAFGSFKALNIATPATPCCEECGKPTTQCGGRNTLQRFNDWNSLASHLSEDSILTYINELAAIKADYERLRDAETDRRMKAERLHTQHLLKADIKRVVKNGFAQRCECSMDWTNGTGSCTICKGERYGKAQASKA